MTLILPKDYHPTLTVRDTEAAIVFIRETFQDKLAEILGLQRMSAPMFVEKKTGLNDNLNGVERPVAFDMKAMPKEDTIEVVHSLAKWKRLALKRYGFGMHEGLYTNNCQAPGPVLIKEAPGNWLHEPHHQSPGQ